MIKSNPDGSSMPARLMRADPDVIMKDNPRYATIRASGVGHEVYTTVVNTNV